MGDQTIGEFAYAAAASMYGKDNVSPTFAEEFDLAVESFNRAGYRLEPPLAIADLGAGVHVSWDDRNGRERYRFIPALGKSDG